MSVDKKWFVDKLRDQRKSQRDLSKHMKLDPSAVTNVLNGDRRLQLKEAVSIAKFLDEDLETVIEKAGVKLYYQGFGII